MKKEKKKRYLRPIHYLNMSTQDTRRTGVVRYIEADTLSKHEYTGHEENWCCYILEAFVYFICIAGVVNFFFKRIS